MNKRFVWTALFYIGVVLFLHRDVLLHLSSRVLSGTSLGGGGEFFIWEFAWVKKCMLEARNPFYTTALLFPNGTPVIFQSPFLTLLSLPLQTLASPVATFNMIALASYVFAGLSLYLLAWDVTRDALSSALAGFVFMFGQYNLTQHALGQLQEATLVFVPLLFMGLQRLCKRPERKNMMWVLLAGCGVAISSVYLFFSVLMVGVPLFLALNRPTFAKRNNFWSLLALVLVVWTSVGFFAYFPAVIYRNELAGGGDVYSLSLLSFIDFPFWHPSAFIQGLREFTSGFVNESLLSKAAYIGRAQHALRATPENLMGFISFTLVVLLVWGAAKGALRSSRTWIALLIAGAILSLGYDLRFSYQASGIPLPYALIRFLPLVGQFRAPARMMVLCWLSLSVLAAVAFHYLTRSIGAPQRLLAFGAILACFSWEMGLATVTRLSTPIQFGPVYETLRADAGNAALLELPLAVNKGGVSINAQKFMLYQPFHEKPLVVASPPRYVGSALSFCETTPYIYELTHPLSIKLLYDQPRFAPRLADLKKHARSILAANGIGYVLFHSEDSFFSDEILELYARFLGESLGMPVIVDDTGRRLYRIKKDQSAQVGE